MMSPASRLRPTARPTDTSPAETEMVYRFMRGHSLFVKTLHNTITVHFQCDIVLLSLIEDCQHLMATSEKILLPYFALHRSFSPQNISYYLLVDVQFAPK